MSTRRRTITAILSLALIGTAALSTACGEPAEADPTPVKTWKITPAATQPGGAETVAPTEPAAGSPTVAPAEETPAEGTPATGIVLEIAAISSTFDKSEMEAPAGPITIKLDNQDAGIIHNIALFDGDDASGELIAATDLEPGPIEQELTVDLEPGSYFYQCDAHPATMKGDLTVS